MTELPLSLSIATADGMSCRIMDKGTALPASKTVVFSTGRTLPAAVSVELLAGERLRAENNRSLKKIRLAGIKKSVGNVVRIAVKADVAGDGTINFEAFDYGSHHRKKCVIEANWAPSEAEAAAAVHEAQTHEAEDQSFLKSCTVLTRADALSDRIIASDRAEIKKYTRDEWKSLLSQAKALKKRTKKLKAKKMNSEQTDDLERELAGLLKALK